METYFLFLDDTEINDPIRRQPTISAITGMLVPLHAYDELRSKFYSVMQWSVTPQEGVVNLNPPELHGRKFLESETDDRKLEVLRKLVELVVHNTIPIYRVGYYITQKEKDAFKGDSKLVGLSWFGMLSVLQPILENCHVVPVMDSCDSIGTRQLSGLIRTCDIMRFAGLEGGLSVRHTQNLIGEVFYADSRFSAFTQMVDIVSYLRRLGDLRRDGVQIMGFKASLLEFHDALEPVVVHDEIVRLRHGEPGPVNRPSK